MVAEEEFVMLYMLAALDMLSVKLLVLKLPRCNDASVYEAILLGLGRAPAFASLSFEMPIFPGLENNLTLDFSVLMGLSGCMRCCCS